MCDHRFQFIDPLYFHWCPDAKKFGFEYVSVGSRVLGIHIGPWTITFHKDTSIRIADPFIGEAVYI